jgi:hypothetical protein
MSIVVRFPLSNVTKQQYDSVHAELEQSGDWPAAGCLIHVAFGDEQNVRVRKSGSRASSFRRSATSCNRSW